MSSWSKLSGAPAGPVAGLCSLLGPAAPVQRMRSLPWQRSHRVVIRAEDADGTCAKGCSDRGAQGTETKHPPPPHPSMETAVPSRGRNTQHKTQPGSQRAGEHTWWRQRKHGPSVTTPAVPLSHNVRRRMKEKGEQSGDEAGGREGSDPERPAMIR